MRIFMKKKSDSNITAMHLQPMYNVLDDVVNRIVNTQMIGFVNRKLYFTH